MKRNVNLSMLQKRISSNNIKVSRTSVDDSTINNAVSSSTTGGPVNVSPAVQSANVVPSSAKPASAVTAPSQDGAANTAVNVGLLVDPFQQNDFNIPSRRCRTESFTRSFNSGWFQWRKWLHYVKETDEALCFTCCSAVAKKLIIEDRIGASATFVKGCFRKWQRLWEKLESMKDLLFSIKQHTN